MSPRSALRHIETRVTWLIGGLAVLLFVLILAGGWAVDYDSCRRQVKPRSAQLQRQRDDRSFFEDLAANVGDRAGREYDFAKRIGKLRSTDPRLQRIVVEYLEAAAAADARASGGYAAHGELIDRIQVRTPDCGTIPPGR